MANEEQLEILKQGVHIWNKWRHKNPTAQINLREGKLNNLDLRQVDLTKADLTECTLTNTSLAAAELGEAILAGAYLSGTNFTLANLTGANLTGAILSVVNLSHTNLTLTNFARAQITQTNLSNARLIKTNLANTKLGSVIFSDNDLSQVHGLDEIVHMFSSTIGTDTIKRSKGTIPEIFLQGCGLSDWEIESVKLFDPNLSNEDINSIIYKMYDLRAQQSIQISPLFISYSHTDAPLVEKLEAHLTKLGVRFWRDVHNAKAGRLETQIDRAMRQNPTVLLVLSKDSTASDWVEHEARLARELEKELGRDVLCPIALDNSWRSAKWPARLMEQIMEYNILDFSKWEDDAAFEKVFNKMINGLDMFYKPENEK